MLRLSQKSIMLWNPVGPARKPPSDVAELLQNVERLFNLSEKFQHTVDPDFILLSIGETNRGAVERAYDWLIPTISKIPDTIKRLPSSASCFLLLKAYGAEGSERKQLKALASPLLRHVRDSLAGAFGIGDCVRAFDLLMNDIASQNADRRRCARRVLQDSLSHLNTREGNGKDSWVLNILELEFASNLVKPAVGYMVSHFRVR
jgi:integrator complex subunit 1